MNAKMLFVVGFVGVVAGFVGGVLSSKIEVGIFARSNAAGPDHLRVRSLSLVDSNGKTRAQLAFAKEGPPGIFLMDDQARARGVFALYQDGTAHLVLNDKDGNATQVLRSFGSEEAPLLIFKNKARDRMILGLNPGGKSLEPFLMHYDSNHQRKTIFGKYEGP